MRPQQKVIIYKHGLRGFDRNAYADNYRQAKRLDRGGVPCVRCGRIYKDPERSHYTDVKNKIPCIERF